MYAFISHNIYTVKQKIKWEIEKKAEVFFESPSSGHAHLFLSDKSDYEERNGIIYIQIILFFTTTESIFNILQIYVFFRRPPNFIVDY